ncbi:MAG: molybdate ABC transporter substrate-binding protein [Betaproteobacteria bacterium]|nr:molybdate ABC transporter substrate-binding protein [Betaproteobacteria bacterium]
MSTPVLAQDAVKVFAAGSLKAALTEAAAAFGKRAGGARVDFTFGPSGLLKERLEKGEASDVFASANMAHPKALADAGKAGPVRAFARNTLCALAGASVRMTPDTLLETLLDPKVKVGISTPKADPSGDYAWQLFANAEKSKPGAQKALEAKALQLTGGPNSPPPPKDRTVYGAIVAKGQADVFLTYCTNAILAKKEEPQLQVIAIPASLNVGADYGMVVMKNAQPAGVRFADFLLSPEGRAILGSSGFAPPQ